MYQIDIKKYSRENYPVRLILLMEESILLTWPGSAFANKKTICFFISGII